jgi:predicted nucleotidyltransferase component of viral defense system
MLDKEKHQLIMTRILRDIYSNVSVSSLLGFKGGTCAYLFYGLSRFSADLDFDLLSADTAAQKTVYEKISSILEKYGEVKDKRIKRNTIFFLLSYGTENRNIKVEASIRILKSDIKTYYEVKEHLGISMLAAKKDYLFASKLAALASRSETAMRDIYDIWFFAKNNWDINTSIIKQRTNKTVKEYLGDCVKIIERVKNNEMLAGLAELLINEKDKDWVKTSLRKEAIFLLKNYQSVLK